MEDTHLLYFFWPWRRQEDPMDPNTKIITIT
jgi:hypothetical protein